MPGGRWISSRDVIAAMERFGGGRGDAEALRRAMGPGRRFGSYEELRRAVPPERIGLTLGAHRALFAPLFGEFE
ncbi:MAG TPA: hypothetical protein VFG74_14900 [Miltoncostaeaceae bacterium]|jgi:hypothetical protein|nr:hypothetical protein [Miltoncostaeaceae bacterium]